MQQSPDQDVFEENFENNEWIITQGELMLNVYNNNERLPAPLPPLVTEPLHIPDDDDDELGESLSEDQIIAQYEEMKGNILELKMPKATIVLRHMIKGGTMEASFRKTRPVLTLNEVVLEEPFRALWTWNRGYFRRLPKEVMNYIGNLIVYQSRVNETDARHLVAEAYIHMAVKQAEKQEEEIKKNGYLSIV